ncbi:unnamed protein product [Blepharisma stoltei]|uniref:IQ calmodulin-binding motif family protein n=1 Tax=Blepharisma stoltei TaxID=1481888 RepID=A0AAU9JHC2_9CILI|nr:unnamed protein product [Blepharisma stoltei]
MDILSLTRKSIDTASAAQGRIQQKYTERMRRTYMILQKYNSYLADEVFNQKKKKKDIYTRSAIKIQSLYRGFRDRKIYKDKLYEKYWEETEKSRAKELKMMEEELIIMENYELEEQIKEKKFLEKQKELEKNWAATVIQRTWRKNKGLIYQNSQFSSIQIESEEIFTPPKSPQQQQPKKQLFLDKKPEPLNSSGTIELPWLQLLSPHIQKIAIAEFKIEPDEEEDITPDIFLKQHLLTPDTNSLENSSEESLIQNSMLKINLEIGNYEITFNDEENSSSRLEFTNTGNLHNELFSMTQYHEKNPHFLSPLDDDKIARYSPSIYEDAMMTEGLPMVIENIREAIAFPRSKLLKRISDLEEAIKNCKKILKRESRLQDEMKEKVQFSKDLVDYLNRIVSKN